MIVKYIQISKVDLDFFEKRIAELYISFNIAQEMAQRNIIMRNIKLNEFLIRNKHIL